MQADRGDTVAERKTQENDASVEAFLNAIEHDGRRSDCETVNEIMRRVTGKEPKMWGDSIVGFGRYHYKYASGREGDLFVTGFSPRKTALTVYIVPGFTRFEKLTKRLGKYKTGKSCLYIKKLDDIDLDTLEELIRLSVERMKEAYGV